MALRDGRWIDVAGLRAVNALSQPASQPALLISKQPPFDTATSPPSPSGLPLHQLAFWTEATNVPASGWVPTQRPPRCLTA